MFLQFRLKYIDSVRADGPASGSDELFVEYGNKDSQFGVHKSVLMVSFLRRRLHKGRPHRDCERNDQLLQCRHVVSAILTLFRILPTSLFRYFSFYL